MPHSYRKMESPVGTLTLVARDDAFLVAILWQHERPNRVPLDEMRLSEDSSLLAETERQLREYFSGKRSRFELPLDFQGTEFQKKVWSALLTIPFGETRSYTEIAVQIGSPNAVRAVGAANGRNPLSIVAPCHRVIGASGGPHRFRRWVGRQAVVAAFGNPRQDTRPVEHDRGRVSCRLPSRPVFTGKILAF
ncbi:methylated-DNA--protein-cysteine methyltransferase [Pseudomonas aeruginosa]|nr:methylated-DNA--protein-cysteine methyltransferase [Pseudomonas aeruginosa]